MGKKNIRFLIFAALIIGNFWQSFPYLKRSYIRINKLRNEREELQNRMIEFEQRIVLHEEEVLRNREDFYKEKIARDRLYMVKEGEEIFRVIDKK